MPVYVVKSYGFSIKRTYVVHPMCVWLFILTKYLGVVIICVSVFLSLARISTSVGNVVLTHFALDGLGQSAGDGDGVDALFEAADPLPLGDPAVLRLAGADHAVKV